MEMLGLLLWADKRGDYFHGPFPSFSKVHGPFPCLTSALPHSLTVVDGGGGGGPVLLWEAAAMAGSSPFPCRGAIHYSSSFSVA
jgi:hypothetical protein